MNAAGSGNIVNLTRENCQNQEDRNFLVGLEFGSELKDNASPSMSLPNMLRASHGLPNYAKGDLVRAGLAELILEVQEDTIIGVYLNETKKQQCKIRDHKSSWRLLVN